MKKLKRLKMTSLLLISILTLVLLNINSSQSKPTKPTNTLKELKGNDCLELLEKLSKSNRILIKRCQDYESKIKDLQRDKLEIQKDLTKLLESMTNNIIIKDIPKVYKYGVSLLFGYNGSFIGGLQNSIFLKRFTFSVSAFYSHQTFNVLLGTGLRF